MAIKNNYANCTPKVSVVIPAYNAAETIEQTLDSAFAQTYPNFEIVVVNDGSSDETAQLLEDYKRQLKPEQQDRLQLIHQNNAGVSVARNKGVAESKGDYIALLDADDLWHPDKLSKQIASVMANPRPDHVFSLTRTEIFNVPEDFKHDLNDFCKAVFGFDFLSNPSGWLFSRRLFERVQGFDPHITAMEDLDFLLRVRQSGAEIIKIEEPLTKYKMPEDGKTYSNWRESHWKFFEKHAAWLKNNLPTEQFVMTRNYFIKNFGAERVNHVLTRVDSKYPDFKQS